MWKATREFGHWLLPVILLITQFLLVQHGYQHVVKPASYDCPLCMHAKLLEHAVASRHDGGVAAVIAAEIFYSVSFDCFSRVIFSASIRGPPLHIV